MTATTPLPLTTSFSPPAACTTDTWYIEYLSGTNYYDTAIDASDSGWWLSQGPTDWSSCFPSGYATNTNSYFSPGVCPSGYWVADQSVESINDNVETRATCCPKGYSAQTENGIVWYSANRCTSTNTEPTHLWTFTKAGTTSSMRTADGINAKAIFIRWQPSDTATQTATGTGASSTASPAPTSTFSPTATSLSNTPTDRKSSKTWIAGPIVGAVVVFALIALAAIWYTRRRNHQSKNNEYGSRPESGYHKPELPTDGAEVFEAPFDSIPSSKRLVAELSARNTVSELP
ncbi:hypothetical protein N7522_001323 [Penicillium canescens]|uniref:Uncharacterized protein n=1 Tax=Penicillium canescens TaxID=5083 RepID=A0AAD6IN88_PENCN|nr:uncharacterized protein N7446_008395 [Penicillium canescens]KAJ6019256.1 hypothetical protein N7522_001323 [Penicillium canescens]KAJ6033316.1 hypothetical protein N7444_011087 [Penicillium canescens]KAJ6057496.1 hypothetical protein N7460_000770 [Penicillium canescens]KAJ6058812.1 hypothetical protein N7446_008395 [Penicillium canescens]